MSAARRWALCCGWLVAACSGAGDAGANASIRDAGTQADGAPHVDDVGSTEGADGDAGVIPGRASSSANGGGSADPSSVDSGAAQAGTCDAIDASFRVSPPEPRLRQVTILSNAGADTDVPFPGGPRRRDAIAAALFDPLDGVVAGLNYEVAFGLGSSYGAEAIDGVCFTASQLAGAPTINVLGGATAADVTNAELSGSLDDPHTPRTLTSRQLWDLFDPDGPRVPAARDVILLLAGESRICPPSDDPVFGSRGPPRPDRELAVQRAQLGADGGHVIHVIDVTAGDDPALSAHFDAIAAAGGSGQAHHPRDLPELHATLRDLVGEVTPCRFELDVPLDPEAEYDGEISIDGMPLPFEQDAIDGFRVDSQGRLELRGGVCRWLRRGHGGVARVRLVCR